jgi:hypothetical protein
MTEVLVVMPGYFAAMNIPILRGRVFEDRDRAAEQPHLVVINQTLATQFYPNENPVGKPITVQWGHPEIPYEIGNTAPVWSRAIKTEGLRTWIQMSLCP